MTMRDGGIDLKLQVTRSQLRELGWLETNDALIFSQYVTAADWVLDVLTKRFQVELTHHLHEVKLPAVRSSVAFSRDQDAA